MLSMQIVDLVNEIQINQTHRYPVNVVFLSTFLVFVGNWLLVSICPYLHLKRGCWPWTNTQLLRRSFKFPSQKTVVPYATQRAKETSEIGQWRIHKDGAAGSRNISKGRWNLLSLKANLEILAEVFNYYFLTLLSVSFICHVIWTELYLV